MRYENPLARVPGLKVHIVKDLDGESKHLGNCLVEARKGLHIAFLLQWWTLMAVQFARHSTLLLHIWLAAAQSYSGGSKAAGTLLISAGPKAAAICAEARRELYRHAKEVNFTATRFSRKPLSFQYFDGIKLPSFD